MHATHCHAQADPTDGWMLMRREAYGEDWIYPQLEDKLPHLYLVNHQLRQLRSQMVLAAELGNAAVILPRFVCGHDKNAYGLGGRVLGSRMRIPFHCPADMILDFRACVWASKGRESSEGGMWGVVPCFFLNMHRLTCLQRASVVRHASVLPPPHPQPFVPTAAASSNTDRPGSRNTIFCSKVEQSCTIRPALTSTSARWGH